MARRTAAAFAIGLTVVLTAAACRGEDRAATQPATRSSRTTVPTAGPTRTTAPTAGPSRTTESSPSASADTPRVAGCGTPQLRWRLTHLPDKPGTKPTALLRATNNGTTPCALDGYPELNVHVGKGPSVTSKPKTTTPVRLVLKPRHAVDYPLFYEASASRHGGCFIPAYNNPRIEVRAPHPAPTDYGTFVLMTDAHGRHVRAAVCGMTMHMGAPRLR
ncbi:DUF4232 domain-containing protein [Streptomyces sp. NPDC001795]|uniref:DUF4232 domain-containing protein n=1 Tax=unclassified Streptomyces TaxID=2593676 RepID=UPI003321C82C